MWNHYGNSTTFEWINFLVQIWGADWWSVGSCNAWSRKRGPALKNRLVEDAEMHQGLLNRESLRAEDGVKYFKGTLRPHFIKRAQSSSRDFFDLSEQGGWTLRWSSGSASSHCSWSVWEMLGWTCYQYPPWARNKKKTSISRTWPEKILKDTEEIVEPWTLMLKRTETIGTPHRWPPTKGYFHSVITWQRWCSSLQVISVKHRGRLTSSLSLWKMNVPAYTLEAVKTVFMELFCTPKAQWRIVLSAWANTAAARKEPLSSKIMLKTNLDNGP